MNITCPIDAVGCSDVATAGGPEVLVLVAILVAALVTVGVLAVIRRRG